MLIEKSTKISGLILQHYLGGVGNYTALIYFESKTRDWNISSNLSFIQCLVLVCNELPYPIDANKSLSKVSIEY